MMVALLVLAFASLVFWLVFFQFKLIRLTPGWGVIFGFFVVHLLLVFVIGLRFVTPNSANATVVQRTIQLVPRLPEPTLVERSACRGRCPGQKGPASVSIRSPSLPVQSRPDLRAARCGQAERQSAEGRCRCGGPSAKKAKVELEYAQYQKRIFDKLAQEQAVREEDCRSSG